MNIRWFLHLLVLLLLSPAVQAESPAVATAPVITFDQGQLSVLRDPSKKMTLEQVLAAAGNGQFETLPGNLGFGYVTDAVWLRFSFERATDQPRAGWLEVMPTYLDNIRLFHIKPDGQVDARQGGDYFPMSAKEEPYRGTVFKLDLEPGQHDIYLRISTTSTVGAIVKLWQPEAFQRQLRNSYFGYGLYFSLIFAVLLFNAANWLVSRRTIFLVYVAYVFLNMVQWLAIAGFVTEFVFPEQPLAANLTLGLSLSIAAAMAFGFFIMILEMKRHHPILYRINQGGVVLSILTAIATPLGHYQFFVNLLLFFAVASLCTAPWPARRLWKTGDQWARLLAAAYLAYVILLGINTTSVLALTPFTEWKAYAAMGSNLAHILLLHFGILLHYRKIEREHAAALDKAADAEKQAIKEKAHREMQERFIDTLSHEYRTPLASLQAHLQVLDLKPVLPEQRGNLEAIREAADRLNEIFDHHLEQGDLKSFSRLDIQVIDLCAKVRDLIKSPLVNGPGRFLLQVVSGVSVMGEPRLLRTILFNLLENARKYSPPDSPIGIELSADGHIRIVNVSAVPLPDDLSELFQRGHRGELAHANTVTNQGKGLGLYLAHQLAHEMGGELTLSRDSDGRFVADLKLPRPSGDAAVQWEPSDD